MVILADIEKRNREIDERESKIKNGNPCWYSFMKIDDKTHQVLYETPVHPMTMDDIAEMRKDVDECAMVQLIEAWLGVDWYGCDIAER